MDKNSPPILEDPQEIRKEDELHHKTEFHEKEKLQRSFEILGKPTNHLLRQCESRSLKESYVSFTSSASSNLSYPFLQGADKYLGGEIGYDGCIYCVPGNAKYVMKINPATDEISALCPFLLTEEEERQWKILARRGKNTKKKTDKVNTINQDEKSVKEIEEKSSETISLFDQNLVISRENESQLQEDKSNVDKVSVSRENVKENYETKKYHTTKITPDIIRRNNKIKEIWNTKFKWLRGLASSIDGNIYGIPSCSDELLQIDVSNQLVTTIDIHSELEDSMTLDSSLQNNSVSGIDIHSKEANKKRSLQNNFLKLKGCPWKWHGGVISSFNESIYCIPCNAEFVLKIDVNNLNQNLKEKVKTNTKKRSMVALGKFPGKQKWYGGLIADNGLIIGIPNCANGVLCIDPMTDEVSTFGEEIIPHGDYKWHGGCVGPDKLIYGVPSHADSVLQINPFEKTVGFLRMGIHGNLPITSGTWRPNNKYKYGGACVGSDQAIYCFPSDADRVLRIDPFHADKHENMIKGIIDPSMFDCEASSSESIRESGQVKFVGPSFHLHNKWQNGYCSRIDGHVYAIPCNAKGILKIKCGEKKQEKKSSGCRNLSDLGESKLPSTNVETNIEVEVDYISLPDQVREGFNKWEGGVVDIENDCMYCMPQASKSILKIIPTP